MPTTKPIKPAAQPAVRRNIDAVRFCQILLALGALLVAARAIQVLLPVLRVAP